jgi:hypothetical protein
MGLYSPLAFAFWFLVGIALAVWLSVEPSEETWLN